MAEEESGSGAGSGPTYQSATGSASGVGSNAGSGRRMFTLPSKEELGRLPRRAMVAFAGRCARRVQPLFKQFWPEAPQEHVDALARAIILVETSAVSRVSASDLRAAYSAANRAAVRAADAGLAADAADAARSAARAAARAARSAAYAGGPWLRS